MGYARPKLPTQPLRVPAGWTVRKNVFRDIEPKGKLKIEGFPDDNGWLVLDQELVFFEHEELNLILDMGWFPPYEPDGKFVLQLVKDSDWQNAAVVSETREKAEIVEAVNMTMLRVSRETGDYNTEAEGVVLQALCVPDGWKIVHNRFFDHQPLQDLEVGSLPQSDGWALFGKNLLEIHSWAEPLVLNLGWEPAHDPSGQFVARLICNDDWANPMNGHSTRNKEKITDIVNRLLAEAHDQYRKR